MFGNAALGPPLAAAHYLANLTLGLLWRWYGRGPSTNTLRQPAGCWRRALTAMWQVQEKEHRPVGSLLAEAIWHSFKILALVGGYITMAAVFLALLKELRLLFPIARFLGLFLASFSLSPSFGEALAEGLVEMTLGTQKACHTPAPLGERLIVTSIVLGWSGISAHGQVASVLAATDLRLAPFILSRLAQGLLAALYLPLFLSASVPAFLPPAPSPLPPWPAVFSQSWRLLGLSLAAPAFLALLYHTVRRFWPGGS
jgi:nucleoside recognition membrane protein YjiH